MTEDKLHEESEEMSDLLTAALDREADKDQIIEQFHSLLNMMANPTNCKKCGKQIWFVKSRSITSRNYKK